MRLTRKAAILSALVSVPLFWNVTLASAQSAGTAAEAKAMLEKAVAAEGQRADALAKFPAGRWLQGSRPLCLLLRRR